MIGNFKVILGISGGIAAIKCADIVRDLKGLSAKVLVVMTKSAQEFVTPTTLTAVGADSVTTSLFNDKSDMPHIDIAKDAQVMVIAPATANIIAKLATGIADDALTTTVLALNCPLLIAPSMNESMWQNVATQKNIEILKSRGVKIIGPEIGKLACGDIGIGRMSEPLDIIRRIEELTSKRDQLSGKYFIVTAGGTREPLDEIRYIGNRSSGKMGFSMARKLLERGAKVSLITGPTELTAPFGCECIRIETVDELRDEVLKRYDASDAVVMAAAVSDYRFKKPVQGKIKKSEGPLNLTLVPAPDILKELGDRRSNKILIGFAAECGDDIEKKAREKLEKKNLDMIIANRVDDDRIGFDSDYNEVTMITLDSVEKIPISSKDSIAEKIVEKFIFLKEKALRSI